jgi:hypothetical protein
MKSESSLQPENIKLPVIEHEHYTVYVEYASGVRFIHMDVHKWSKAVKQAFLADWNEWAERQEGALFAMPFIDDKKMRKWAVICGFEVAEDHSCLDGVIRRLYIWRANHG